MSPIDPTDFKPQGKPTLAQMRAVHVTLVRPTVNNLTAKLAGMGYKVSRSGVGRAIKNNFEVPLREGYQSPLTAAEQLQDAVLEVGIAKKAVGQPLTSKEITDVKGEIETLYELSIEDLKALRTRENLIYNILLLRFGQRKAEALSLLPRESAAMVMAMSEAASSMPEIASSKLVPHQGNGNGAMIDVTPNPPNEVASAIASFRKKDPVAA